MGCSSSSRLTESGKKPLGGAPSAGGGREYVTVQPFAPTPENLRGAIGERRGQPIGIERALEGANPFYAQSTGAQGNFEENCQRCVTAYELRRRGYDVVALPTYGNDPLPTGNKWRGAFRGAKAIDVGSTNPRTAQENLERQMKKFGNGSRGIVEIPHHVFNVENVNGKIRYVDAQTNTIYNSNNVFSRLGRQASQVKLIRTDNLRISERAKKSVTPSTSLTKSLSRKRSK